jgi:hypothetical protein
MLIRSTLLLSLSFSGFNSYLFVVLFKGSEIFSGFGKLTLFHTFSDVPMDEGSFGVHQIEFVIESAEDFSNGSGVTDHAACSHDFSEITSWDNCWGLIVDSDFESSWAPVDELNGSLGLDGGNG